MVVSFIWYNFFMGYLLALSLGLRLVLIDSSLWLDESIQAMALMGRLGPLLQYALADFQPPLYHLIGYFNTQLFGYSEIALRLPSLLSGLLTVYFLVKIGRLLGGAKVGNIVGVLSATNPLLIYYSQEGRTYALTAFLVTASFYYLFQLLKQKSRTHYLQYFIFTVLYLWTSYLAWFALLAQGLLVIWKKRSDLLIPQALSALTLLAWLPSFLTSLRIGQSTLTHSPEWGSVVGGLNWKTLPLTWVKFVIGRIGFDDKLFYAGLVGVIGIFHLYVLRLFEYKKHLSLLYWALLPILFGLMIASLIPVYQYFRVLFVLPAYLLILSLALSSLKYRFTLALVSIQLLCLGYYWMSPRFQHEDWRRLVTEIPHEAVVAIPSLAQSTPLHYYGLDNQIIEPSRDELSGETIYYIRYAEDLFDTGMVGQAKLKESGYTIVSQKTYPGIALDIYAKN